MMIFSNFTQYSQANARTVRPKERQESSSTFLLTLLPLVASPFH